MNLFRSYFLTFLVLILCFSLHTVEAKDYTIPKLQVEVQINEDGSLRITEHRTYVFDGSYSWANYNLPKSGFSSIYDIQVSEGGTNFTNLNTEEPGTFLVEESPDSFNIKWFYSADTEERIFTISYTLKGALVIGPEWSEFFWNYASANREKDTDLISILIQLPETIEAFNLHSWIREPAWSIESDKYENGFQFKGTDINKNQAVIIRTLFPTSVFDESINVNNPDFSLENAQKEEINYRKQQQLIAEENERLYKLGIETAVILSGLSILCFIFFYRKYGIRHKINLSQNKSLMIPGNQKPAVIGWLIMNRTITGALVTATLLDLARQRYFTIKEEEPQDEKWYSSEESGFSIHPEGKEPDDSLNDWELDLLSFVKKRVVNEGHSMKDVFKFTDSDVSTWFYAWKKKVSEYSKKQGWIDTESYTGAYWNAGIQIFLLLAATTGIFIIHPILAVAAAIAFFSSISSLAIIRRTPKGEELYQRWKNYQSALKNAKEYSISNDKLGLHFIYGIALGLGEQHFEQMFKQNPEAMTLIYWIVILPGNANSPANIASSFSKLAATGTISSGGGGVTGGGASAGVAGGGASGGAG